MQPKFAADLSLPYEENLPFEGKWGVSWVTYLTKDATLTQGTEEYGLE